MSKTTTLVHPLNGEQEFNPDHADRIMSMENNGGWKRKSKSDDQPNNNKRKVKDAET